VAGVPDHPGAVSYADAHLHDTSSQAWRDICLARWVCRLDDLVARREFLGRFRKRHGDVLADHLDALVREQWRGRAAWLPAPDAEPREAPARDLFTGG